MIPMEEMNLHLTEDIHAIGVANNLLAATSTRACFTSRRRARGAVEAFDAAKKDGSREFSAIMFKRLKKLGIDKTNPDDLTEEERSKFVRLDIDPDRITWRRVVDMNDRFCAKSPSANLRRKRAGRARLVSTSPSRPKSWPFSPRPRPSRTWSNDSATWLSVPIARAVGDVHAGHRALMAPCATPSSRRSCKRSRRRRFSHAGPFANIASGNSSIIADQIGLPWWARAVSSSWPLDRHRSRKFVNLKCRKSGLKPNCAVIVATVRRSSVTVEVRP